MSSSERKAVVFIRNLPKRSGDAPRLPYHLNGLLRGPRAGVVLLAYLLDGFKYAVLLLEVAPPLAAVGEAFTGHRVRFHAIEDVEEIVGVAAHQRARQRDQLAGCAFQHAQAVAPARCRRLIVS